MFFCLGVAAALVPFAGAAGGFRGWNTFDAFGAGNEDLVRGAAQFMNTHLAPHGYDLVTLDGGWSANGGGTDLDAWGRPVPDAELYPSTAGGAGFAALAGHLRGLGLRLGLWTIRGVPAAAVLARTPIWGSNFTADQAARLDQNCSWDGYHVGVRDNAAGRAYYASLAALYAGWGVAYVKADCMCGDGNGTAMPNSWAGLYTDDFAAFSGAMRGAGIAVSTSPGWSMGPRNASWLAAGGLAAAYRISQDMGDHWLDPGAPRFYPTGVKAKLVQFPLYAPLIGVGGAYPDGDMLPVGTVWHSNPDGPASPTHLTRDEQRLMLTLWCVVRAPLVIGGALPLAANDTFTLPLLTNPEVLAVQNASAGNAPIRANGAPPGQSGDRHAWAAAPLPAGDDRSAAAAARSAAYVALFNGGDAEDTVSIDVTDAGLPADAELCARDLWARAPVPGGSMRGAFSARLPPHGAGLYLLAECRR